MTQARSVRLPAVRGQRSAPSKGDTLNVYLRSQAPVKNIDDLREIKLPSLR